MNYVDEYRGQTNNKHKQTFR